MSNYNSKKYARKIAISQRWDEDFLTMVKSTALITGRSMTQLTMDALNLLSRLVQCEGFLDMKPKTREDYVVLLFENSIKLDNQIISITMDNAPPSSTKQPGMTKEKVEELLKNNPGKKLSSTEIADLLHVPQSTVRAYIRKLSLTDEHYVLIEGRPNYIYFRSWND